MLGKENATYPTAPMTVIKRLTVLSTCSSLYFGYEKYPKPIKPNPKEIVSRHVTNKLLAFCQQRI